MKKNYKRKMQMAVGRAVNEGYEAVAISGDDAGNMQINYFRTIDEIDNLKDWGVSWFEIIRFNLDTKKIKERVVYEKYDDSEADDEKGDKE